ncbi:hypothetical protein [Nostoc sp.]|uniref:hypothetical protein n=1 Tax=Nostoc sp. TaxID=1180 RepID=UPI002FF441DF
MIKLNTRVLRIAMSKPGKKQGNPDFRHRVSSSAPTSEEIESRLVELVTPGTFANLKGVKDFKRSLCDRRLTYFSVWKSLKRNQPSKATHLQIFA